MAKQVQVEETLGMSAQAQSEYGAIVDDVSLAAMQENNWRRLETHPDTNWRVYHVWGMKRPISSRT
ncbi:hypothetical protein [Paenibacillus thiaminolyticus]|uniref:hypothetical protein n=1 Tax=Paenibacillus thiaminolyticus TaxID=49283 RepID=UPI002543ED04|nr:hypothetical protein [Paenibacillus thiaminolyticus]WII35818.1 hypothetical protein O0V01_19260 [Paenibacillus thiaminolyticus]